MGKCFELRDAFPPIQDVIEELCQRNGEAGHAAIVNELIKHKAGSLVVNAAVARCSEHTKKSVAGNMGEWFSQKYTSGQLSDFEGRFKRREINRSWAYSRR
jgi:hypothetical protein